jgi:alpha-L-arabinofuranosidase
LSNKKLARSVWVGALALLCIVAACDRGTTSGSPNEAKGDPSGNPGAIAPPADSNTNPSKEGSRVAITRQTLQDTVVVAEDTLKFAPAGSALGTYPAADKQEFQKAVDSAKAALPAGKTPDSELASVYDTLQNAFNKFRQSRHSADLTVTLDAGKPLLDKPINRHTMGFNAIPFYLTDDVRPWIIPYLQQLRTGIMRYPGGEVASFFHWDYPDVSSKESKLDVWDPQVNAAKYKNPKTKNMTIDEFMEFCRLIGADPAAGVNIESGVKWNRVQDSVDEAVRNLKYTMDRKYPITYWYMDNESYLDSPSNHVFMKVDEYAKYVNQFSSALKAVNPNIKTVVNWHPNNHTEWKRLFELAGSEIDVAEKHQYWRHNSGTYAKWMYQNPLTVYTDDTKRRNKPYEEQLGVFRQVIDESFPADRNVEIGILEWNIGGKQAEPMSPFQIGLVQVQILAQIIKGGVDLTTMWPLNWPGLDDKTLVDSKTKKANPDFEMFKLVSNVMGQKVVAADSNLPYVYTLGTAAPSGESATLFLINKTEEGVTTPATLNLANFKPKEINVVTVTVDKLTDDKAVVKRTSLPAAADGASWKVELPPHSFTAITFGVNKDGLRADIANAKQMDAYGTQVKSADALRQATADAEKVVNDAAATQAKVDEQVTKVQGAMAKFAAEAYGKGYGGNG